MDIKSQFDRLCSMNLNLKTMPFKLTKIICTIGPTSRDVSILETLIDSGMNIARLNLSHGTHEYHRKTIENIRQAVKNYEEKTGYDPCIAVALDTRGREIRTGLFSKVDEVELKRHQTLILTTDKAYETEGSKNIIFVSYKNITNVVNVGNRIFMDDGLISLICEKVDETRLFCRVENGGILGTRKGINLPGVKVDLPPISESDKLDMEFGVSEDVDMIFGSFTPNAAAVIEMRKILGEKGHNIKIISKIENQQGLENVDEIIKVSDGIMVERGDLGSEIPLEKVFMAQKSLIAKCNKLGTPVICATQMLESMVTKPRPTRAEVSDVANAVLDGADCVMLSGETAKGDYPVECVSMMANICKEAEVASFQSQHFVNIFSDDKRSDIPETVAIAAVEASLKNSASAIIVLTTTGRSARLLAKFKPNCPVIAVTRNEQVNRQLQLHRAVYPILYNGAEHEDWTKYVDSRVSLGIAYGRSKGFIGNGDKILVITGWKEGPGHTNAFRVIDGEGNPIYSNNN